MSFLPADNSPLTALTNSYLTGQATPSGVAEEALAQANGNASRNSYLAVNRDRTMADADRLQRADKRLPLYGVPVSVKDCFDMASSVTTAGSSYYAEKTPPALSDSAVVARLQSLGAILIGKTHMHPLAYGITGENSDYGDCVQPRNAAWLTGGSSSGAAASVQEGSALIAIGTDTGGSLRVPAALCGLTGYRASIAQAHERGLWQGSVALAESFDTLGCLFASPLDAPRIGAAIFGLQPPASVPAAVRIGVLSSSFLHDCEAAIMTGYEQMQQQLRRAGATIFPLDAPWWENALEIFAPIQAAEAAAIHRNADFSRFPKDIADRLRWGAAMSRAELEPLRMRHEEFRARMDELFVACDFLLLPCAPMATLEVRADHTQTRPRILRYTVPFSLGGNPVVALPAERGGLQLAAARGNDATLLRFAAQIADAR